MLVTSCRSACRGLAPLLANYQRQHSTRLPILSNLSNLPSRVPSILSLVNVPTRTWTSNRATPDQGKGSGTNPAGDADKQQPKLGVVGRFKQMYRDYWYVLVPVHLVTSACWFTGFYYLAKSGVDVIGLLKSMGVSEKFTDPLKDSSMGYFALSYALYKIATPLRYTVTVGGTTISIKYLQAWGYIKPMPSKEQLKEMYQNKKEEMQEIRLELRQRKHQFKERKDHVMSDIAKYKQEVKEIKENESKNV